MRPLDVLVAAEESQEITKECRKLGHNAFSCDLQPAGGGYPEWHIQGDLRELLGVRYDLVIFHPTCRYLSNSGVRWLKTEVGRYKKMREACQFFNLRHKFNSDHVATENPVPHGYATDFIGNYDQCYQPWQFGEKQMKATCLWLKGLPPLIPTDIVGPPPTDRKEKLKWQDVWMASPGPEREKLRSRTLNGVARAIAKQWSNYVLSQKA